MITIMQERFNLFDLTSGIIERALMIQNRAPIMRNKHIMSEGLGRVLLEQPVHTDHVAQTLAHLLLVDGEVTAVPPVVGPHVRAEPRPLLSLLLSL